MSSYLSCCVSDLWKPEETTTVPRTLGQDSIVRWGPKIIDIPFRNAKQMKLYVTAQSLHYRSISTNIFKSDESDIKSSSSYSLANSLQERKLLVI